MTLLYDCHWCIAAAITQNKRCVTDWRNRHAVDLLQPATLS